MHSVVMLSLCVKVECVCVCVWGGGGGGELERKEGERVISTYMHHVPDLSVHRHQHSHLHTCNNYKHVVDM